MGTIERKGGKLMNRARILASGIATVVSLCAFGLSAGAQQQPSPLSVKKLADDVYWTQGGAGGNTGIIIGKDGVIVVDAKTTADSAKQVLAEIAKLTPKPVTTVILTTVTAITSTAWPLSPPASPSSPPKAARRKWRLP